MALSFYLNNLLLGANEVFQKSLGEKALFVTLVEIMVGGTWVPCKNENPGR